MHYFMEALTSSAKGADLPEEYDYFGSLVGSWTLDYTDCILNRSVKGEWHFARVLEGMAIQDVIILPSRDTQTAVTDPLTEYGTTLRIYNPDTHAWDIAYGYTGKIMRLEARKENDMIVLTNLADQRHKWVFVQIKDDHFHWQNITVKDDGQWHINADIHATRLS